MKPQAALRLASFFAVKLAVSIHSPNSLTAHLASSAGLRTALTCAARLLALLLLMTLPDAVQAQFTYTTNNGAITITKYDCVNGGGAVTIPGTITGLPVTGIGDWAFSGCASLSAITVEAFNTADSSVDGVLFNQSQSRLIQCPEGKSGSYAIPNGVTSIGNSAFYNCTRLTSVTRIGDYVFSGCTSLTNVTIPSSVTSIGGYAFSGCASLSAITVEALNTAYSSVDGVLFNQSQTTPIQFPGGKAGSYTIPNGATSIANGAFCDCTRLTSVTIPRSVTSIGEAPFHGCTSLSAIEVEALRLQQCGRGLVQPEPDHALPISRSQNRSLHGPQRRHQHRELRVFWLHQAHQRHDPRERHLHRRLCLLWLHQPDRSLFQG